MVVLAVGTVELVGLVSVTPLERLALRPWATLVLTLPALACTAMIAPLLAIALLAVTGLLL
jgi:hypothetical protein